MYRVARQAQQPLQRSPSGSSLGGLPPSYPVSAAASRSDTEDGSVFMPVSILRRYVTATEPEVQTCGQSARAHGGRPSTWGQQLGPSHCDETAQLHLEIYQIHTTRCPQFESIICSHTRTCVLHDLLSCGCGPFSTTAGTERQCGGARSAKTSPELPPLPALAAVALKQQHGAPAAVHRTCPPVRVSTPGKQCLL